MFVLRDKNNQMLRMIRMLEESWRDEIAWLAYKVEGTSLAASSHTLEPNKRIKIALIFKHTSIVYD